jgi:hypothetical protein
MEDNAKGFGRACLEKYMLPECLTEEEFIQKIESGERKPYEVIESDNLWLNGGWTEILKLITGESSAHFDYTNSRIGIGDSSTAASAAQTDLLAATNKTYKGMESNYPTSPSSQQISFRAKFTTSEANYAWAEMVLKNASTSVCWDRVVDVWGTKTASEIWYMTLTIGKA